MSLKQLLSSALTTTPYQRKTPVEILQKQRSCFSSEPAERLQGWMHNQPSISANYWSPIKPSARLTEQNHTSAADPEQTPIAPPSNLNTFPTSLMRGIKEPIEAPAETENKNPINLTSEEIYTEKLIWTAFTYFHLQWRFSTFNFFRGTHSCGNSALIFKSWRFILFLWRSLAECSGHSVLNLICAFAYSNLTFWTSGIKPESDLRAELTGRFSVSVLIFTDSHCRHHGKEQHRHSAEHLRNDIMDERISMFWSITPPSLLKYNRGTFEQQRLHSGSAFSRDSSRHSLNP